MTKEINQAVAKALYGDNLIFHDDLMATSREKLEECLKSGWFGYDNIRVEGPESFCVKLPDYSGSMRHAWPLVEKITKETEFYITNMFANDKKWDAHYKIKDWVTDNDGERIFFETTEADTAPQAICLLFLKFKGCHIREVA